MKTTKFWTLCLTVAIMAVGDIRSRALDGGTATPKINANLELARQLNEAFVQVADEVSPAVVVIKVTQKPTASSRMSDSDDESGDPMAPFRRFFNQRQQDQPQEKTVGQGSGIIIRADGFILTNRHVVEDAEKIEVRLKDGRTFMAEVRGVDAPADVAVIKIDAKNLTVAKLADSDKTRVGEFAIAIGAPFALDYTVTFGHVSAKNRTDIMTASDYENPVGMLDQNFIQTDANINPGNSGGPLINIDGEVIGINTLIRGLHTGIGFAIPSNMAREVADQIITTGKFTRAWLGIEIESLSDSRYRDFVQGVQDGVLVKSIVSNGPASHSDLQMTDVITTVDGKPVITVQQLKDAVRSKKVGQNVTLDVFRPDIHKHIKVLVKPGEWVDKTELAANDSFNENRSSGNALGMNVRALTPELAKKYGVDVVQGVIVVHVDKRGLAADSGIQEGDIITSIDKHPVTSTKQFLEALRNIDTKKGAVVNLISDGTAKFEVLKQSDE